MFVICRWREMSKSDWLQWLICDGACREVQSSGTLSKEQAEGYLSQASVFLTACAPEQIRLAPEKCEFCGLSITDCKNLGFRAVEGYLRELLPLVRNFLGIETPRNFPSYSNSSLYQKLVIASRMIFHLEFLAYPKKMYGSLAYCTLG